MREVETVNNQFAEIHVYLENLENEFNRLQVHDHADREPGGELPVPERRGDRDPAGEGLRSSGDPPEPHRVQGGLL